MKIVIIGNGGSGKSTLAEKMSQDLSIPVYHLDNYTWKSNFERIPVDEFKKSLIEMMGQPNWIIDGWSYHETMHERLLAADVIIYLEFPLPFCLDSAIQRNRNLKDEKNAHDPFRLDRREKEDVLMEAIHRVHDHYEPEVRKWLEEFEETNEKLIFRPLSRKELIQMYTDIILQIQSNLSR